MLISLPDLLSYYESKGPRISRTGILGPPLSKTLSETLKSGDHPHIDAEFLFDKFSIGTISYLVGDYPGFEGIKLRFVLIRIERYKFLLKKNGVLSGERLDALLAALESLEDSVNRLLGSSSISQISLQLLSTSKSCEKNIDRLVTDALSLQPYEPSPGYRWMFLPATLKAELLGWRFAELLSYALAEPHGRVTLRIRNIFGETYGPNIINGLEYTNLVEDLKEYPPKETFDQDLKLAFT